MKTDLVTGAYIFFEDKLLLIHHGKLDLWLPVGGHIDKDETPDDSVLREIKEETNLDAEIIYEGDFFLQGNVKRILATPFHVNVHSVGDHNHCCFFYVCRVSSPKKLKINNELKSFRWFSREDLGESYIPADVRAQALRAFEIIEKHKRFL